ncbi:MAG: A circularly permuted ATPgrasp family protein [Betaproteobacteria bacterium]|nr:A circularly permuted ATPgrasp family protein [Betaproteobacteria bacterium]
MSSGPATGPWQRACALAAAEARPGEPACDELTGAASQPAWQAFFEAIGHEGIDTLAQSFEGVQRQIRANGITYNVYADADGPQRPWSLDLFPLIVSPDAWRQIEHGVLQRTRLLNAVTADIYGKQTLLRSGLLPRALVQGDPGYLRSMHGAQPPGGTWLHIAAFDLVRGIDGNWSVAAQRTQAPSGLGYLLENRLIISRQFPQAFASLRIQRLAATYRALADALRAMCPGTDAPRIALLTPGPYNETYFEHAYLARYLGLPLVEGSDLTVRDRKVYLKTLQGLERVHGLLRRLDDEFLDPLELRSDSQLGVAGLLRAIHGGEVMVANMPGAGFLESSAVLGFLPALCEQLLGEPLALPSLDTWWCGEQAALQSALPELQRCVIQPRGAHRADGPTLGAALSQQECDEWSGRILREPECYTLQQHQLLSRLPVWRDAPGDPQRSTIGRQPVMLRVFAVCDGPQSWRVLPGGLARLAVSQDGIASMQRGGSSADVWVMTEGEVDGTTLLPGGQAAPVSVQRNRVVTSRAAENLFWLGRYTERTENTTRLARLIIETLNSESPTPPALLHWLDATARANSLVLSSVPSLAQSRRVFERSLAASLGDVQWSASVGFNLRALHQAAASVRERLSLQQWNLVHDAHEAFLAQHAQLMTQAEPSPAQLTWLLDQLAQRTSAMTGAQTDRMTRDAGWRLLSAGRNIERLAFLSGALAQAVETGAVFTDTGYDAVIALFDSTITFRAHYQQRRDLAALVDLLVLDPDNPRSITAVLRALQRKLSQLLPQEPGTLALPDAEAWTLASLCDAQAAALVAQLWACQRGAFAASDDIAVRCFIHGDAASRSVGL